MFWTSDSVAGLMAPKYVGACQLDQRGPTTVEKLDSDTEAISVPGETCGPNRDSKLTLKSAPDVAAPATATASATRANLNFVLAIADKEIRTRTWSGPSNADNRPASFTTRLRIQSTQALVDLKNA